MTLNYGAGAMPSGLSEKVVAKQECADCLLPMG